MFRYVTDLKALIIDTESFQSTSIAEWNELVSLYNCLFIVLDEAPAKRLRERYPDCHIYLMERHIRQFAPSAITHSRALKTLGVKTTEAAYLSADPEFLQQAASFMGGTIWVTRSVNYRDASHAPDLICHDLASAVRCLKENVQGFLGELRLQPGHDRSSKGACIPVRFDIGGKIMPIYILGRYFGSSHYMNQLHPYSTAIMMNKKEDKPYYGVFNHQFSYLFRCGIKPFTSNFTIHGIVSVPARPGSADRFAEIRRDITQEFQMEDLSRNFTCVRNYPPQISRSSSASRRENIEGVFQYDGDLTGKNIIIIDDIVTTGATLRECVRVLDEHGADRNFAVVLAINQLGGNYWSDKPPQVSCPVCGAKMTLTVNRNAGFFYNCLTCYYKHSSSSLDYERSVTTLIETINSEFDNLCLC